MSQAPRWVSLKLVLAIHARQILMHGGEPGVRNAGLLESALAAPMQKHAYGESDPHALAASCAYAISRNHPFVDGNKRCSLVVSGVFLELNGWILEAEEAEAAHAALAVAAGRLSEKELAAWFRAASSKLGPASRRTRQRAPASRKRAPRKRS